MKGDRLADHFGVQNVFILSAGCGLIPELPNALLRPLPSSASAEVYKWWLQADGYRDLNRLPAGEAMTSSSSAGRDYLPQFCALTAVTKGKRIVFYSSAKPPSAPGCQLRPFHTSTRTNWHYGCGNAFVNGSLTIV